MKKITIIKKTWLKKSDTKQSFELDSSEKVEVKAGAEYPIVAIREAKNNHLSFTLDGLVLGAKKYNSWYVYKPHTSLGGSPQSSLEVPQTDELPKMSGSIDERVVAFCDAKGYPLDRSGDVNIIGIEATLELKKTDSQ
ncbi:MAG: hypothetical protein QNJ54_28505 [Prochloraceae cyanobacterium]|nr:hypothetical protein [Prochloraceae cyanobacterium]